MNLRDAILQEHSKAQTKMIVDWIGHNASRIDELMQLFIHDEYRVVQRAAWMVSEVARQHPNLFKEYLPLLIEKLKDEQAHQAVKRNIFRIFEAIEIPEELHGSIMHHCFSSLENPQEALAVRAFAIGILCNLLISYPEIINEFQLLLEDAMQHEVAPSFKSRANKALKQMKRMKK